MIISDRATTPDDHLILIAETKDEKVFGVGPYRGAVSRLARSKWQWRAWNVVGPVTLGKGVERTQMDAIGSCTDTLRKAAGIEHVVCGS